MKGSDLVKMTINIDGESITLNIPYDRQDSVREAETAVRQYTNKLRHNWPDCSERKILAMTAWQFAMWYKEGVRRDKQAIELAKLCADKIDGLINPEKSQETDRDDY